jgi:hypothetical protein
MAESTASSVASLAPAGTMNASFTLPMKFTRKSEPSLLPASHAKEKDRGELLPLRHPRLLGFGCAQGMFAVRQPPALRRSQRKTGRTRADPRMAVFMSMVVLVASILGPVTGEWEKNRGNAVAYSTRRGGHPGDRGGCHVPRTPTGIGEMPEQFCG